MLDSRAEQQTEEMHHYLERIKVKAGQLNMIVQDILEFSRAANRAPEIQDVELGDVLHDIRSKMLFKIKQKEPPEGPPFSYLSI